MLDLKPSSESILNFSAGMLPQAFADGKSPGYLEAAVHLYPGCGVMHCSPVR